MIRGTISCGDHVWFTSIMKTTSWIERLRGLLGRPEPEEDGGLLLEPCSSIHTVGMGYPIDVVLLDRNFRIRGLRSRLSPMRCAGGPGITAVLELRAGTIERKKLAEGMQLIWQEEDP